MSLPEWKNKDVTKEGIAPPDLANLGSRRARVKQILARLAEGSSGLDAWPPTGRVFALSNMGTGGERRDDPVVKRTSEEIQREKERLAKAMQQSSKRKGAPTRTKAGR